MDESLIYELQSYLPIKLEDPSISDYISYHIQELSKSIENNIDSWIFLHTHIIYMTFIYIQLLRISENKQEEFRYSWIWLPTDEKTFLKNNKSPFSFSKINEKTVFRFFRLINFDDATIWELKKCIDERNELFHATWKKIIDLEQKIDEYLKNMEKVKNKSSDFFVDLFTRFEQDNSDLLEEWYEIIPDDLELNLYIPYFFSEIELRYICTTVDDKVTNAIKSDLWFDE